jgi:UDP-3-O-[3-hydroxymyristoyl] glucosamine N-acyltransferase
MTKKISVKKLVSALGESFKIRGDIDREITTPSPIDKAERDSLVFCSKKDTEAKEMIKASRAGIIIASAEVKLPPSYYKDRTIIQVANPRLAFIRVLEKFFKAAPEYGIHPTAIIDPKAKIAKHVFIGPYATIGECEIGEGTMIHSHVHIFPRTRIGKNVTVFPGAVIGRDGYGFERNKEGKLERFPQIGGVVIENDVEIGSNTVVDRGAMGDTIIREGTKIDNLCHIAHSAVIGKHCMVIALSMIGGSTIIGDYSHIAPSASLINKIKTGKNVLVGMGAVVTGDVADNQVVVGVPAKPIRENV